MDLLASLVSRLSGAGASDGKAAEQAAAPGKRTAADAAAASDPVIGATVARLQLLGVREDRLGKVEALASIHASIPRDLQLLEWIAHGGGSRGAKNRIISAWNAGQDGLDDRARYPTLLHYVHRLDRMARDTMGMTYERALEAMPDVRLAGAGVGGKLPVHPRAVYFCAAAQVGMDVRAGIEEGQGHYVPVGGFKNLFADLKKTLRRIGTGTPFDGAAAAVTTVQHELRRMLDVLAAQEAGVPFGVHRPDEHLEPDLRRTLVPLRADIAAVGEPTDDAEATSVAARLAGILRVAVPDLRELHRNHGSGSVDPHGEGHATGLAIDMFYGAGEGRYGHQNKAIKAAAWPFLYQLIAEKGDTVGLSPTLRPAGLGQLSATDARAFAQLLRDEGPAFRTEMADREPDDEAAADDRRVYGKFRRLRARATMLLIGREHALTAAAHRFKRGSSLRDAIHDELAQLHHDRVRLPAQDPETVPMIVLAALQRLGALELQVGLALDKRDPDLDGMTWRDDHASGKLVDVVRDLEAIRTEAQPVVGRIREAAAIESARDPYTRWLVDRGAQDDRLVYDQPSVMVEALNEVRTGGSALQASHHWVVAPRDILEGTEAYGAALRSDMRLRHHEREPPQLERVLAVMAESAGGRALLTAPMPRPADVDELHAALAETVGGDGPAAAMIERVAARVIEPYETAPTELGQLRDRGFYVSTEAKPAPTEDGD